MADVDPRCGYCWRPLGNAWFERDGGTYCDKIHADRIRRGDKPQPYLKPVEMADGQLKFDG